MATNVNTYRETCIHSLIYIDSSESNKFNNLMYSDWHGTSFNFNYNYLTVYFAI